MQRVQSGLAFSEPNLQDLLVKVLKSGRLTIAAKVAPADIHIIAVPTLLNKNNQPEISSVYSAIDALKPHLRKNDLVIIESTCPIGTTEAIANKLRVLVAYCPERVIPGEILHELIHNDRVIGGVNTASTEKAVAFYRSFVKGEVYSTDSRTAEAVKLAENCYRDINIAYANEISMIADRIGLNTNEVIRLANRHPRVDILQPGTGVGGYCLTANPWFLASSAPDLVILTTKAREVNTQKTDWVIQKIKAAIHEKGAHAVACLGITYKANVSDTRKSTALTIIQALEKEIQVFKIDPYVPNSDPLQESLAEAQIVIGLVAHREFKDIKAHDIAGKTILDFAGVFS